MIPCFCSIFDSAALVFWLWGLIVGKFVLLFVQGRFFFSSFPFFLGSGEQMSKTTEWPANAKIGWVWLGTSQFKMSVSFCCDFVQSGVKPGGYPRCLQSIFWNSETTFLNAHHPKNCSSRVASEASPEVSSLKFIGLEDPFLLGSEGFCPVWGWW